MKEIVIVTGAANPEKRLLAVLRTLFPECAVRIVYAGSGREEDCISAQASDREMRKTI